MSEQRRRRSSVIRAVLLLLLSAAPCHAALTEGPQLAAAYESILNMQFDRADAQLGRACPPAPVEACQALRVVSLWWQIQIHPESRARDQEFTDRAAAAIAANAAWTRREPLRAEAWFYLAGSYAPLVQWRVLRGQRLAAAREGGRIKNALERALQLDPTLDDAHFGIGLYRYYADVAPAAAKLLRWLLWLPGGDRVRGLQEMARARDRGLLVRGEADYQLHLIYLWYEHRSADAIALLHGLDARYPFNPLFLQRAAEAQDTYLDDHPASAASWRELLARAQSGRVYGAAIAEVRARLGLASELAAMDRVNDAIEQLQVVIAMHPSAPTGALTRAEEKLRALIARQPKK